jgi:hypothetical protein
MNTLPNLVATDEPTPSLRVPGRWRWLVAALLLAGGLVVAACSPTVIPRAFGFQGRLTDSGGNPVTATKVMTFTLWTQVATGQVVFTETQTVAVNNGLFNVFIGQSTLTSDGQYGRSGADPENFAVPLFVQVQVDGETLTPRTRLGAAPTSMGLVGGAVVVSDHDGNGISGAGSDVTNLNYASLSVIASSTVSGTALLVGHALGNTGDLIRACGSITDSSSRTCPERLFRVRADGDVNADGAFTSPASDFAEMFAASDNLKPGDVLAIGADGKLVKSSEANQATVVGVYSTKPGFVANGAQHEAEGYVPVALVGVVPVKVTGAIRAGDLLVASNVPGHAMRGGGNPAAGTVIGKALQSSKTSYGTVLMLVMTR